MENCPTVEIVWKKDYGEGLFGQSFVVTVCSEQPIEENTVTGVTNFSLNGLSGISLNKVWEV